MGTQSHPREGQAAKVGECGGPDGDPVQAEKGVVAEAQVATALRYAVGPESFHTPRGCIGGSYGAAVAPEDRVTAPEPIMITTANTASGKQNAREFEKPSRKW